MLIYRLDHYCSHYKKHFNEFFTEQQYVLQCLEHKTRIESQDKFTLYKSVIAAEEKIAIYTKKDGGWTMCKKICEKCSQRLNSDATGDDYGKFYKCGEK